MADEQNINEEGNAQNPNSAPEVGNDPKPNVEGDLAADILSTSESLDDTESEDFDFQDSSQKLYPYKSASNNPIKVGGAFIPLTLTAETTTALNKMKEAVGDIDAYIVEKLGYDTKTDVWRSFASEQIDAIALQIFSYETDGSAIILGDMAGTGKGRVCAGICRYAYLQGLMPLFITEKANLFSDFYRDLNDIGGFPKLNHPVAGNLPIPLILNAGSKEKIVNKDNSRIKPSSKAGSNDIYEPRKNIAMRYDEVPLLFTAQKQEILSRFYKKNELPRNYQLMVATYSQFQGKGSDLREKFVKNNADKIFVILDESHNAAGESSVGRFFQEILPIVNGAMFSSATYSKRVSNLKIYALRNAMRQLGSINYISQVLDNGRDRLNEYIATGLAEAGHLLRRERSFGDCQIDTKLVQKSEEERIFEEYDNAVRGFIQLRDFLKSDIYQNAVASLIQEVIDNYNSENNTYISIAPEYDKNAHGTRAMYNQRYTGFYTQYETFGIVGKNHFNYIEQLLFSVKAESVAKIAVEELQRNQPDADRDGIIAKTTDPIQRPKNYTLGATKPIIAVKNTLESIFKKVGITEGKIVDRGDFGIYFQYLLASIYSGSVTFKKIGGNKPETITFKDLEIKVTPDSTLDRELKRVTEILLGLKFTAPLSPIDTIIQNVESERANQPTPFSAIGDNFTCREISGRKTMFIKLPDGRFQLVKNSKTENNVASAFQAFNDGRTDFLIINKSGSTGASAHSSPQFKDTRPRTLLIHQVELNVQTEVQKRGRVNRTGQLWFPRYIYIISPIPSETRRMIMLMRKLKTLDALSSGNQKQSEAMTTIQSSAGVKIRDFINKYGWKAARPIYLEMLGRNSVNNDSNAIILNNDQIASLEKYSEEDENGEDAMQLLMRYMELQFTSVQIEFYNKSNTAYFELYQKMDENGTWDLDTEYRDFQSVTRNRFELVPPKGEGVFNQGVYVEDCAITADDKRLTKDTLKKEIAKALDNNTITEKVKKERVLKSIEQSKETYLNYRVEIFWASANVNLGLITDDEERNAKRQEYEERLVSEIPIWEFPFDRALALINSLIGINKNYNALDVIAMESSLFTGSGGGQNNIYARAKCIDIKVAKIPEDRPVKYNTIAEFSVVFAYYDGLSTKIEVNLFNRDFYELLSAITIERENAEIDEWQIRQRTRVNARFLTGNLFRAYAISSNYITYNNEKTRIDRNKIIATRKDFVRFSEYGGRGLRYGIRLYTQNPNVPKLKGEIFSVLPPKFVSFDSEYFIDLMSSYKYRDVLVKVDADTPLLFLGLNGYGNGQFFGGIDREFVVAFFTKGRKKEINNPFLQDSDWRNKMGLGRYFSEGYRTQYRRSADQRFSSFEVTYTNIGYHLTRSEAESFCKYLANYYTIDLALDTNDEGLIEVISDEDTFSSSGFQTIEREAPDFGFVFVGHNTNDLSSLFANIPESKPAINQGGIWQIYLSKFPSAYQLMQYDLCVPKNRVTPKLVIDLILEVLVQDEALKYRFLKELKDAINDGSDDATIYNRTFNLIYLKFSNEESIFGLNTDIDERGELLRLGFANAADEGQPLVAEEESRSEIRKLELNLLNAQKYMILLEFMTKKM
jgi:hypothetical protein